MIETELLEAYGAEIAEFENGDIVFREGDKARFYHQVEAGEVKMSNLNEEGKEFIQRIFSPGRSFGEPPLFGDFNYPADAIAMGSCRIWQLPVDDLFRLLREHPQVHFRLTSTLAERLYYKAIMAGEISYEHPGHRIMRLLKYLKHDVYGLDGDNEYEVELTRRQISELTGLRVETTIRAIKELEASGELQIRDRKIRV